jgi:hypothetical protein
MRLSRLLFVLLLLCFAQSIAPKAAQASGLSPNINCNIFPADNIWNTPINTLPVDTTSTNVFLNSVGTNRGMHADFGAGEWDGADIGIPYILSGAQAPVTIVYEDFGDESDPGPFPIPLNAPIEGGPNSDGDRHVLVVDDTNCVLYELYRAFPVGNTWHADSGARYDLNSHNLRPLNWTSADAAGLPILPGLVRYEEILAGSINHAIRFTLSRTADGYVWPARHEAGSYSFSQHLPMGARLRLKDSFNINAFSSDPSVRIILQAMKTYGIILADNGSNMYFSGAPDSRWDDDALHQFGSLTSGNFEVVDTCSMQVSPNSGQAQVGVNPPPNNCTSSPSGGNQFIPSGVTSVGYGNPLYQWMDYLSGAQYYYLTINNSAGVQVVNEVISDAGNCNGDICSLDPTLLRETYRLVNGSYSAYINTWNGSTQGTWRGPFYFTLSAAPPNIVTLDAPTNVNTLRPTFNWTLIGGAANATYFNLVVSPTNNPSAPSINQWFTRVAACGSAISSTCALVSPIDLLDGTNYTIYVRSTGPGGLSTGGVGGFAGPENFTVDVPAPSLPANILVNNNQGRATFTWNDDPNALYFNLYVTNNAGVSQHNAWYARSTICTGGTCSVTPAIALANGGYQARVKGWGSGGFSVGGTANDGFGGPTAFTFNFDVPNIAGVITVSPTNAATIQNGSPTFTWNTIAGTTYYLLWVTGAAPSYAPVYHQVWYDASTICTAHPGTCTVSGIVSLPIGNAVWRVQAYGPGGVSALHTDIAITVNSTLPSALTLNNPTGTITTNAPTFTWQDNADVDYYHVYINSGASVIVNQWYAAERGAGKLCNAGQCSLTIAGTTFANGAYTWNVRAFAPAGVGAWATPKNFTVNVAAPSAPVLSSPAGGAIINTTNRPTFVWNTTNGVPWYHLEVKNGMGTVVFDRWYGANTGGCNATTCTVQLPNPIAYGGYSWRVQAYTQGGVGSFSPSRSFLSLSINPQPMMVQSNSNMVHRSGLWNETTSEFAVDQSYLTSSGSTADTLTFGFTGTEAQVVYIAGPSYGSFVVEVDGVAMLAVNANATQDSVGNLAQISGLSAGQHTLRIVPLGGAPVAIDALIVDGQIVVAGTTPLPPASPTIVIPIVTATEEVTSVPTDAPTIEVTVTPIITETPIEAPTEVTATPPTDIPTIEPTPEASAAPTETPTEVVSP